MKDFPGHSLAEIGHVLLWAEGKEGEEKENGTSACRSASSRSAGRRFLTRRLSWGKIDLPIIEKGGSGRDPGNNITLDDIL